VVLLLPVKVTEVETLAVQVAVTQVVLVVVERVLKV